jgi:hypothetical protein
MGLLHGLAIGLIMVVYLLWLIVSQGFAVFWPKPIAQLALRTGAEGGGPTQLAGEIVKKQVRAAGLEEESEAARTEWQLFIGNGRSSAIAIATSTRPKLRRSPIQKESWMWSGWSTATRSATQLRL